MQSSSYILQQNLGHVTVRRGLGFQMHLPKIKQDNQVTLSSQNYKIMLSNKYGASYFRKQMRSTCNILRTQTRGVRKGFSSQVTCLYNKASQFFFSKHNFSPGWKFTNVTTWMDLKKKKTEHSSVKIQQKYIKGCCCSCDRFRNDIFSSRPCRSETLV